jgi:hypothetical protein
MRFSVALTSSIEFEIERAVTVSTKVVQSKASKRDSGFRSYVPSGPSPNGPAT